MQFEIIPSKFHKVSILDFPGTCFASTRCATFEPGASWDLKPFCGRSTCVAQQVCEWFLVGWIYFLLQSTKFHPWVLLLKRVVRIQYETKFIFRVVSGSWLKTVAHFQNQTPSANCPRRPTRLPTSQCAAPFSTVKPESLSNIQISQGHLKPDPEVLLPLVS